MAIVSPEQVALVAFVPSPNQIVSRDCERNDEVRRQIAAALVDLPPEPPLTEEQEAECIGIIGEVLRKRGW